MMDLNWVCWCILLLSSTACFAEDADEEDEPEETVWGTEDVVELSEPTFKDFTESNPAVLVAFYAPWCGHCKRLKPEYAKAATTVRNEGLGQLAAVDCIEKANEKLCKKMEVEGFPTIKFFKAGGSLDYDGGRTAEDIVAFMKKSPTPPPPEPPVEWDGSVIQLDSTTFAEFIATKPSVLAMFYEPDDKYSKKMKTAFQEGARLVNVHGKAEGKLVAVDCEANKELCDEQGLKRIRKAKYYKDGVFAHGFGGERTVEGIVAFMKNPQPPPPVAPPTPPPKPKAWKDDENTNVIHLDEKTFDAFLETEPRVFVCFYTNWCGASKNTMLLLEKVGKLANVENQLGAKLAAVDCEENKELCEKYKIDRYPTGIYIKKVTEQVPYKGGATMEEIVAFAKEHASPDAVVKDIHLDDEMDEELDEVAKEKDEL